MATPIAVRWLILNGGLVAQPRSANAFAAVTRWVNGKEALAAGDAARNRGLWEIAAKHYGRYLRMRPQRVAIWVQLGHAQKEAGRLEEAVRAYEMAIRLNERDADLLLSLGHVYKLIGKRAQDLAIEYYRRSADADGNAFAQMELANLGVAYDYRQAAANEMVESPFAIDHGAALRRGRFETWLAGVKAKRARAEADAARDRRDWQLAVEGYQHYLEFGPDRFAIWVQLGHALKESHRFEQALSAYKRAFRLNDCDADLLLSLGHIHKILGDRERAILFYLDSAAIDFNNFAITELDHLGVRRNEILAYCEQRKRIPDRRNAPLSYAPVRSVRTDVAARFAVQARGRRDKKLGDLASRRRNWAGAVERYRRYLEVRPNHFEIWVQLGHALKESGRLNDALGAYSEAYRLEPDSADLLLNIGHLKKVFGRTASAASFYRRSAQRDGNENAVNELVRLGVAMTGARATGGGRRWLTQLDRSAAGARAAAQVGDSCVIQPSFSFVMRAMAAQPARLRASLDSLLAQSYPDFEICVAEDQASDQAALEILRVYAKRDDRLKVVDNPARARSLFGRDCPIDWALGEFIVLLDDDAPIANDVLYLAAEYLNGNPDADLFYLGGISMVRAAALRS